MKSLVSEAILFLKDNLTGKGKIFAGFSGGKDSIVIAKLLDMSGLDYQLYHTITGIDPPEVMRFMRRNYKGRIKYLRPSKSFWHSITTRNPPAQYSRWCCDTLKKIPSYKIPIKHRVMGIRSEESGKRKVYPRINHIVKKKKVDYLYYYPILSWNESQVWQFIEEYNLSYPSLYDEGFSRIGCVICPYHSAKNRDGHKIYRERWPKYFKKFEKAAGLWFEKRKSQGKEMYFDTSEEFCREWYNGNVQFYKR